MYPNTLYYSEPASEWLEALPIGNGRLGAMVYGGIASETVQLNEGTIWAGRPHDYATPGALTVLPQIRELVFAGEWEKAQELVNARFMGRPVRQMPYQPAGFLNLQFHSGEATQYRRELDLDAAVARTSYIQDGVHYTREVFASYPDNVVALRISADKPGCVSLLASLTSPHSNATSCLRDGDLVLDATSGDAHGVPGQVAFQIRARISAKGASIISLGSTLSVSNADSILVLLTIGTNYVNYEDLSANAAVRSHKTLDLSWQKSYEALLGDHMEDHRRLYRRFTIDLGASNVSDRPTNQRIATHNCDQDPALAALYCRYGRYLLIASSRDGGLGATLQGLWNDSLTPPWESKFTININTEMNYWPAGVANLLECYEPLLNLITNLSVSGRRTARTHYKARGWVAHHNTDGWMGTAPVDGAFSGMWPTGGAWLCKSIWDHFEISGDLDMLWAHYPALKGAAQFFLDTLVVEPSHGFLVTNPSMSPENAHHPSCTICAGPAMDTQILRDLFNNTAEATRILGVDAKFRRQVLAARARLAPDRIGKDGQLQEWLEDWDSDAPEPHHRHNSHLYALYPATQITPSTPELFAAARRSLELRGDESTGWSMGWRINLWARLRDGDHAHRMLTSLLTPGRTAPNMFDLHPPFQIDGNFGGSTGIIEMLMQSVDGAIDLLPALPAAWPAGSLSGALARGGFEVSFAWTEGKLASVTIRSHLGRQCRLRSGRFEAQFMTEPGASYHFDGELNMRGPS